MSAYEFFFFMYELKCAIEAQFKIQTASSSVLLGGISHSTSFLIFRNMWGKNTKTLFGWLKADLMNVKWKLHRLDTVFPHFDEGEIITIDVGAGHAEDKRGPVNYWSCSYWRMPLQHWCNPITPSEWITDMPSIQIDRAKGGWRK